MEVSFRQGVCGDQDLAQGFIQMEQQPDQFGAPPLPCRSFQGNHAFLKPGRRYTPGHPFEGMEHLQNLRPALRRHRFPQLHAPKFRVESETGDKPPLLPMCMEKK